MINTDIENMPKYALYPEDEAALSRIAKFLSNYVKASCFNKVNYTFLKYKIKRDIEYRNREAYYSEEAVFNFIKYIYENKKEKFIPIIEHLLTDPENSYKKFQIEKILNEFLTLGYKLTYPYNYFDNREIKLEITNKDYFELLKIHQKIREVSESLFNHGDYTQATTEAFKKVINMVKEKTNTQKEKYNKELNGESLMMNVFNEKKPLLKFNKLKTVSDIDEQRGFKFLFAGTIDAIRNPRAHEIINDDKITTIWYLSLASLLATILDKAENSD